MSDVDLFGAPVRDVKSVSRASAPPPDPTPPEEEKGPEKAVCAGFAEYQEGSAPRLVAGMAKAGDVLTVWH